MLETEESALARGATIIAEIAGVGTAFDPRPEGFDPKAEASIHAVRSACTMAGIAAEDIDFVAADANGVKAHDAAESRMIATLFASKPVVAYKSKTGECYGASPALNVVCAMADLAAGHVSGSAADYPVMNGVNLVVDQKSLAAKHALVHTLSCDGYASCLVLRKRS
jgi:3-oxoacyl-(acyl-carrier-protein) synthase